MIINTFKTIMLFGLLSILLLYSGKMVSQNYGIYLGLILSVVINLFIYFYSDQLLLSMHRVLPLHTRGYDWLHNEAKNLAEKMNIPTPKLWLADMPIANAFAVGRNPANSSIVFTQELLNILKPEEIRGILSHELSHVKNRDTLLGTVASTMAGVIGYIGYMARRTALSRYPEEERREAPTPFTNALLSFILPIGATLLRLAISRSREFSADETGSHYSQDPLALAVALEKLEANKRSAPVYSPLQYPRNLMTESLFIINPFTTNSFLYNLLSTHPPIEERIQRLKRLYQIMVQKGNANG